MIPIPQLSPELFLTSLILLMSWFSGQRKAEDDEVINAHEVVQRGMSDGDFVNRIELMTGKNLRDQLSIAEMEQLENEIKILKMGNRRN